MIINIPMYIRNDIYNTHIDGIALQRLQLSYYTGKYVYEGTISLLNSNTTYIDIQGVYLSLNLIVEMLVL